MLNRRAAITTISIVILLVWLQLSMADYAMLDSKYNSIEEFNSKLKICYIMLLNIKNELYKYLKTKDLENSTEEEIRSLILSFIGNFKRNYAFTDITVERLSVSYDSGSISYFIILNISYDGVSLTGRFYARVKSQSSHQNYGVIPDRIFRYPCIPGYIFL